MAWSSPLLKAALSVRLGSTATLNAGLHLSHRTEHMSAGPVSVSPLHPGQVPGSERSGPGHQPGWAVVCRPLYGPHHLVDLQKVELPLLDGVTLVLVKRDGSWVFDVPTESFCGCLVGSAVEVPVGEGETFLLSVAPL